MTSLARHRGGSRNGQHRGRPLQLGFLLLALLGAGNPVLSLDSPSSTVLLDPEDGFWQATAPDEFSARVVTSAGEFVVEAHRAWAPLGVDRFFNLVRSSFFDDSRFFRVREGYIAQFGIPGEPSISTVWRQRAFEDDPVVGSNTRGTVAFAMTGPGTRTTQLYVNLVDNTHLDQQGFAPIGEVVEGMEVVDALYQGYDESAGGGMRRGQQDRMFAEGNVHLDADFPRLSRLIRATIE